MGEIKIYHADLESTGLLHHLKEQGDKAKLHNFCAMSVDGKNMWTLHTDTKDQRDKLQSFLNREIILVMHNGICYDKNALKHFNYDISKVHFVDTLALSWYLDLNRDKHGLESYGEEFGVPKPEIKDWSELTQVDYDHRVKEDVKIQFHTYNKLKRMFEELYGEMSDYEFCTHKVVKYLNFKMEQLSEQQNNKIKIDVEFAKEMVDNLQIEIDGKRDQLRSVMPKVPEYSKHTKPAKPFKKDGSLSAHGEKWKELCEKANVDFNYVGEIKVVKCYNEPNPASSTQMKDWLFSLGWIPETFKFVKDENGERQIPQVYLPQSGGQICPSIERLAEEVDELNSLIGLSVAAHRKSCIQGFLDSLIVGEFIEAGAHGFTNTLRLKHRKPFVNLPSSRVVYGKEVRSCITAREGKVLIGADLSSLENRIKFNLQLPYDRKYVMSQMSDDFDPHLEIAKEGLLLTTAEVNFYKIVKGGFPVENYPMFEDLKTLLELSDEEKQVEIKRISKIRGKGKNTNYACQYSAGGATVARTAGVDLKTGKSLVKAYKKLNWSIDKIAKSQTRKTVSHGMYQLNPFNGIWYHLKTEKDAFSTLVQGTGAYILDVWLKKQFDICKDIKKFSLLATAHDEQILEVDYGLECEVSEIIKQAISKVNEAFKLEIPFGCDVQFGKTYADIH